MFVTRISIVVLAMAIGASTLAAEHPLKNADVGDWVMLKATVTKNGEIEEEEARKMILAYKNKKGDKAVLYTEELDEDGEYAGSSTESIYFDHDEFDAAKMLMQPFGGVANSKKTAEGEETITIMEKEHASNWITFTIDDGAGASGEIKIWFVTGLLFGIAKAEMSAAMGDQTLKIDFLAVETGKGEVVDLGDFLKNAGIE